jgi:hypothetical protein
MGGVIVEVRPEGRESFRTTARRADEDVRAEVVATCGQRGTARVACPSTHVTRRSIIRSVILEIKTSRRSPVVPI